MVQKNMRTMAAIAVPIRTPKSPIRAIPKPIRIATYPLFFVDFGCTRLHWILQDPPFGLQLSYISASHSLEHGRWQHERGADRQMQRCRSADGREVPRPPSFGTESYNQNVVTIADTAANPGGPMYHSVHSTALVLHPNPGAA